MGKVFGFAKSDCQKVVLNGGRKKKNDSTFNQLAAHELQMLIINGDPSGCNVSPDWKPILN
jgi:hypothetical protein